MKRSRPYLAAPVLVTPAHLPSQFAIRFRLLDSDTWHDGRVEDLADETLVFLSDLPLERGTLLEVALPVAAPGCANHAQLGIQLDSTYARVVERVLERWPDLSTAVTARFLTTPAQEMPGAA